MALQFGSATTSMFGGAATVVSSPSIIGATYHVFMDASHSAVATATAAPLLTEITFVGAESATVVPTSVNITTEITLDASDGLVEVLYDAFLMLSITARLLEPSIKDITVDTVIIDFVETDERTLLRTDIL